ncbi:MAG: hypothetical protein ACT4O1_15210 [Gemmatimonadota bacterium]
MAAHQSTKPLELRFRTNPDYAIVPIDRVPARIRRTLDGVTAAALYGLLQPRRPGLRRRWIDRDAALLLLTLREAGTLDLRSGRFRAELIPLILAGVLQVERGRRFVSGADALAMLGGPVMSAEPGRCAELSLEALEYAGGCSRPPAMPPDSKSHPLSLYRGAAGVAVLAAEIRQPELARMPFFELER